VAVGRDGRLSGPALSAALIRGLVAAGVEVIDIGPATTPMLYFAACTVCSSGIQVTGSHNPKDYNGFKMVMAGKAIYGEEIQALRRTIEADGGVCSGRQCAPCRCARRLHRPHRGRCETGPPMKLVVDCGNGIAGASARRCSARWAAR
jgi:phosphomannomutase